MAVVYQEGESFADLQNKYSPESQENDVGFFESALAGVATGLWNIPKGFVSLGAELFDLVGDTDTARDVEQWFDDVNPFDDEAEARTVGKVLQAITQVAPMAVGGAIGGVMVADRVRKMAQTAIAAKKSNPKLICNWIIGELFSVLNKKNKSIQESPIKAIDLGELINLIDNDTITGRIAKDVFEIMLETGENPNSIVDSNNMRQVNDLDEIEKIIDVIIINNPNQVEALSTKPNLIGWFVGQVMKESQGKANPKTVNNILNKKLLNKD